MTTKDQGLRLIDCSEEEHAGAILEILNEAIVNSTALYDYVLNRPGFRGGRLV